MKSIYKHAYVKYGGTNRIHLVDTSRVLRNYKGLDTPFKYPLLCSMGRFYKGIEFTNSPLECDKCKIMYSLLVNP